jgi:transcriptional regulator with XRE-family HTH domain
LNREIAKRIKIARERLGIATPTALATRLGVSRSTAVRWERGKSIPTGDQKQALKDLFRVGDEFFDVSEFIPSPIPIRDGTVIVIRKVLDVAPWEVLSALAKIPKSDRLAWDQIEKLSVKLAHVKKGEKKAPQGQGSSR